MWDFQTRTLSDAKKDLLLMTHPHNLILVAEVVRADISTHSETCPSPRQSDHVRLEADLRQYDLWESFLAVRISGRGGDLS